MLLGDDILIGKTILASIQKGSIKEYILVKYSSYKNAVYLKLKDGYVCWYDFDDIKFYVIIE